jgi:hypothetical protein
MFFETLENSLALSQCPWSKHGEILFERIFIYFWLIRD